MQKAIPEPKSDRSARGEARMRGPRFDPIMAGFCT
jgi:hypothetical protein